MRSLTLKCRGVPLGVFVVIPESFKVTKDALPFFKNSQKGNIMMLFEYSAMTSLKGHHDLFCNARSYQIFLAKDK